MTTTDLIKLLKEHEFDRYGKSRKIVIWEERNDDGMILSFMSKRQSLVIHSVKSNGDEEQIEFVVN